MTTPKATPRIPVTSGKDFAPPTPTDKTLTEPLVPAIEDPTPIEESEKEAEKAEKQGRNADVPNPDPMDPDTTIVPPGPGATVAASLVAQSKSSPTAFNDPVQYDKKSLYDAEAGVRKVRHISDPELKGYRGKLDLETGKPIGHDED